MDRVRGPLYHLTELFKKCDTVAKKIQLCNNEHKRMMRLIWTCKKAIEVTPRGNIDITTKAKKLIHEIGFIYFSFFMKAQKELSGKVTAKDEYCIDTFKTQAFYCIDKQHIL